MNTLFILYLKLFGKAKFIVEINAGKLVIKHGNPPKGLLRDGNSIVTRHGLSSGLLYAAKSSHGKLVLKVKGAKANEHAQMFRNALLVNS
ncbi:MAG: hypothetical protein ACPGED_04720 [Flavobacteriales bacterium]